MRRLQPIQIDENTIIYLEATDTAEPPSVVVEPEATTRTSKGLSPTARVQIAESFQMIENTIKTYTRYTLNAFRDSALAEVKAVKLEFGVNVSGMGGIPYIASGTAECNIKVTVECAFAERKVEGKQMAE
jgi:hypothetical protein